MNMQAMVELENDFDNSTNIITDFTHRLLTNIGINDQWINYLNLLTVLILATIIVYILQLLVNKIFTFAFKRITKVTHILFFKYAIKNRVPHFLALVAPYSFVKTSIPIIFTDFKQFVNPSMKIMDIYLVFMIIWTIMAIIQTGADVIKNKPAFRNKPLKSYLQVIQIILFIFGSVVIYSIITGQSPAAFFAAMGAASAVLMLMFKDTIMGFVASIQISTNNMVRLGDWITMTKYGADGTVAEINLTTVKIINFDNTITTIPTYALISDSFQNWRGMLESEGRRFIRVIYIKQSDIRALIDKELNEYKKLKGLTEYINQKQEQFDKVRADLELDPISQTLINRITNNDIFMQYTTWYLKNHPDINNTMSLGVKQLPSTSEGLPIQLLAFTKTTNSVEHETIISEILNHLISSINQFGLTIFERPASNDLYKLNIGQTSIPKIEQ